ncbi:MAG: SMP-30/gluconolactonase/LRE family protein [Planctomycetota bacterium]|jgi:gluconolactonase
MNREGCALVVLLSISTAVLCGQTRSLLAPGASVEKLAGGFAFTEGPAADGRGNVFFSDIPNNRIHKWSLDGKLSTFRENSGGANGLFFDASGNLLACEGGGRRLVSISPQGVVTVLADRYQGKPFNSLNDLWIDPKGGVYFTDPRYGRRDGMEQGGEHVYYLSADRRKLIRVIDDMVRPNGVIGTPDGGKLYVTDHGGGKTFAYTVKADGTLSNKRLFAPEGSDGMTLDNEGNIYLTTSAVSVYNKEGRKIETIEIPERPANVAFGGADRQTLFVTARTSLYSVRTRVKGVERGVSVASHGFEEDVVRTSVGDLKIAFIGHGTLMFTFDDKVIHVDPVGRAADYSTLPRADLILLTHEHGDHLDAGVVKMLRKRSTEIVLTETCAERIDGGIVMRNGETKTVGGLKIEAAPAYNLVHKRSSGQPFHPKGRGNGYVIMFGDKRVYVAGDTENTPEMKKLRNIDIPGDEEAQEYRHCFSADEPAVYYDARDGRRRGKSVQAEGAVPLPLRANRSAQARGLAEGLARNQSPNPQDAVVSGYLPLATATRLFRVRKNSVPYEIAGVAICDYFEFGARPHDVYVTCLAGKVYLSVGRKRRGRERHGPRAEILAVHQLSAFRFETAQFAGIRAAVQIISPHNGRSHVVSALRIAPGHVLVARFVPFERNVSRSRQLDCVNG